ncbi:MAG: HlyD family efflux transporter periplasmic adaptor subunit [Pseudomonadota bacterium]
MRRQLFFALLILLAGAIVAVIMVRSRPSVDPEPIVTQAPLIQTTRLARTTEPLEIVATGTVAARERVSIAAQVGGRIVSVSPHFIEGGQVDRGETLIRLDRADFENRVRSARADLAAQDVSVLQAEQEVEIAQDELTQFDARFGEAVEASPTTGFRPPEGLTNGTNSQRAATGPQRAGSERLLASREPQLRSAEAARDRAQATLSDAELALSRTVVRAPFPGIVQSETAAVGTIVNAGQTIGEIVASDRFDVRVSLSNDEAALIPNLYASGNEPVEAIIRSEQGGASVEWDARVSRVSAVRDARTRRVDIFVSVEDPLTSGRVVGRNADGTNSDDNAPPLLIGTLVEAVLEGRPRTAYALVDTDYLRNDNRLWLLEDGALRIVETRLIARTDDRAAITFLGLSDNHVLITSDLRAPVDGMALRTEEAG